MSTGSNAEGRPPRGADGSARALKDQVSRMCRGLDEQVEAVPSAAAWRARIRTCGWTRRSSGSARRGGVRQKALVIAYAVHESGIREVLGIDVGEAETEAFWTEFLFSLKARGLSASGCASQTPTRDCGARSPGCWGAAWQRCTVHFLSDMLGHCGRSAAADDRDRDPPDLQRRHRRASPRAPRRSRRPAQGPAPKVAGLLEQAEDDLLAFYALPARALDQAQVHEPARAGQQGDRPPLGRRRDLPQRPALIRLAGMLLIEQNDEWLVQRRYLSDHSIRLILSPPDGCRTSSLEQQQGGGRHPQRRLRTNVLTTITSYTTTAT